MSNKWLQHVKTHMNTNNVSFKTALKEAVNSYRNNSPSSGGRRRDNKGRFI